MELSFQNEKKIIKIFSNLNNITLKSANILQSSKENKIQNEKKIQLSLKLHII